MIFTQMTITNFGVYRGRQTFNLRPQTINGEVRPIILFGGKNGAGKTTILEAIRLCLYGRGALGARVRRTDYDTFIQQRFHRNTANNPSGSIIPLPSASVRLSFEHTHSGVKSTYDAIRSWRMEGQTLREDVSIYKDGTIFHEVAPDYWNDFLRDLIPQGVADLFFFDGEQIQALANDDTETEALAVAIRGLLSLDLVERLQTDLSIYVKQQDDHNRSRLEQAATEADDAYNATDQEWQERNQDRAQINALMAQTDAALKRIRDVVSAEGGVFLSQHDQLDRELKQVEQRIETIREELRDLASGLLPFAVSPQWSERLRVRLEHEAATEDARIAADAQHHLASTVTAKLLDPDFQHQTDPTITRITWEQITQTVQSLLLPADSVEMLPIRHHLARQDRNRLLEWIDTAIHHSPERLHTLTTELEACEERRVSLAHALRQVPEQAAVLSVLDEFTQVSERKGHLQAQFTQLQETIRMVEVRRAELDRQRQKAWQHLAAAGDTDLRVHRAAKVRVILEQYLEQITVFKIRELEQAIVQYFNLLCRKRHLIHEVRIDPRRFTVALYRENRIPFYSSELSAGEKQLYAMALLWALRSVSGRALPIIIDTPMGRLDSDHRQALFDSFFPHASHQVIVLSTDTEITPETFGELKRSISHTFLLEFDQEEGYTEVHHEYFHHAPEEQGALA